MGQELSGNVCNFLMFHMILNGVIEIDWINLSKFHIVYSYTVISEGLTMNVTDCTTHLEELLVKSNCFLEFTKVVIKNTGTVI